MFHVGRPSSPVTCFHLKRTSNVWRLDGPQLRSRIATPRVVRASFARNVKGHHEMLSSGTENWSTHWEFQIFFFSDDYLLGRSTENARGSIRVDPWDRERSVSCFSEPNYERWNSLKTSQEENKEFELNYCLTNMIDEGVENSFRIIEDKVIQFFK